ncbi:hypothetical protein F8M41_023533 [Gigaspora margarita]|uniref:Uncharacterized protein n=1 Tax=Gigaspora margarita TaxID=4874 RepID=A0A8H4AD73_GIGMA|nr:hypothetical protein F8M41_023533 [Gigaspora margarita]
MLTISQPIQQRPQQLQHFLQTISRPKYNKNFPIKIEDIVFEEENICDLDIASNVDDNTSQYETDNDELEEELQINYKNNDFDSEDLQGTTLMILWTLSKEKINQNVFLNSQIIPIKTL